MQKLKYIPFEKIKINKPVDRFEYISSIVKYKHVLDLGCFDETAYQLKSTSNTWLHGIIAKSAKAVVGIDNSNQIPDKGLKPFNNSNIYRGNVFDLIFLKSKVGKPDIIIAGELIEHLDNPLVFLKAIKQNKIFANKTLIMTTPNATSLYNHILGIYNRESCHIDHLSIYSYKTINTLCKKAGFKDWEILSATTNFTEMILKATGIKREILIIIQKIFNKIECHYPLLAGTLIVKVKV